MRAYKIITNTKISFSEEMKYGFHIVFRYIFISILVLLSILLAFLLFVLPGLYLIGPMLLLAPMLVIFQNKGIGDAIQDGFKLTKGHIINSIFSFVIYVLITSVIVFLLLLFFEIDIVATKIALGIFAILLSLSFPCFFVTCFYIKLLTINELPIAKLDLSVKASAVLPKILLLFLISWSAFSYLPRLELTQTIMIAYYAKTGNFEKFVEWTSLAINEPYQSTAFTLAQSYHDGKILKEFRQLGYKETVTPNSDKAIKWAEIAARGNDPYLKGYLALILIKHKKPLNQATMLRAMRLLEIAGESIPSFHHTLALLYLSDKPTPLDVRLAKKWLQKAAKRNYQPSIDLLKALENTK